MTPLYSRVGEHISTGKPTAAHVYRLGRRTRPGRCLLVVADPPEIHSYPSFERAQAAAELIILPAAATATR